MSSNYPGSVNDFSGKTTLMASTTTYPRSMMRYLSWWIHVKARLTYLSDKAKLSTQLWFVSELTSTRRWHNFETGQMIGITTHTGFRRHRKRTRHVAD